MSNCQKVSYQNKKRAKQSAYAIKCKGYISPHDYLMPYWYSSCGAYHLLSSNTTQFLNKVAKYNK